jgi:hypothetical protein
MGLGPPEALSIPRKPGSFYAEKGGNGYPLIGQCYLQAVMFGQAVKEWTDPFYLQ